MTRISSLHRAFLSAIVLVTLFAAAGLGDDSPTMVLTYERGGCGAVDAEVGLDRIVKDLNIRLGSDAKATAVGNEQVKVEVVGERDQAALDLIKEKIGGTGCLEFRILANVNYAKDKAIIKLAESAPATQNVILQGDKKVAEWVPYVTKEFANQVDRGIVKRETGKVPEALLLIDEQNVTGQYFTSAKKESDGQGGTAISFSLNDEGAKRFRALTSENLPDASNPTLTRQLGVVLDKKLLSAPTIRSAISDRAMISGGSMTAAELDTTVRTINRGSLPRALHLVNEKRVTKGKESASKP